MRAHAGMRCARSPRHCMVALFSLSGASAQSGNPIKVGVGPGAHRRRRAAPARCCSPRSNSGATTSTPRAGCSAARSSSILYDDQSTPSNVPGIYTKLITVDKVDLLLGPYATNFVAPAMPTIMQHNKMTISLTAIGINRHFNYDKYFSMVPVGPDGVNAFSMGFFEIAAAQKPKPQTVAILAADAEFARSASRRRPRGAEEARLQGRLRPELSAGHHRLHADGARGAGGQPRHRLRRRPIRRTTSASSAPPTRSASTRRCSAAP